PEPPPVSKRVDPLPDDVVAHIQDFCSRCHAYAPPNTFPRAAWKDEVEMGYRFFAQSKLDLTPPAMHDTVRYYQERAPEELPPLKIDYATSSFPVMLERITFPAPTKNEKLGISHIHLVNLSDPKRKELLATDMVNGWIMALRPWEEKPTWRFLGQV